MTINIADNSPRVSYAVAEGVTQTSFTVSFEFFDNEDLNVYVDGTLKTLTTDYTVSGGDGSTGTVTMSVTGATGGSTVVITRDIDLERTTDFPASGAFNIATLNTELDRLIAIAADLDDRAARAIQAQDFDSTVSYTLPLVDDRKGKVLGFNATTGAVEAGPEIADTQSLADVSADIALLADIQDGTTDTNALTNLNSIRTDVTTVSGISANVSTVATNNANVTTVADNDADISTVATNISSVNTVATNIADVITVANDLNEAVSEVVTVADDLNEAVSEIDTVASSISNVDAVGGSIANVNTVATDLSGSDTIGTVAADISNVNTVAGISSNVTTVAGISANVTTVANDGTDIGTVATNISNVNAVAGNSTNINAVAGNATNINAVAGDATDIGTVATDIANVNTVAGISANVTTVAGISSNVTTVAGISSNVTTVAGDTANIATIATDLNGSDTIGTVAGISSNVTTVAGISSDVTAVAADATDIGAVATNIGGTDTIGTVAGNITNVNNVGNSITNVNTVATNLASVNSFADTYRIGATDPTTSLDTGDLFYNTTSSTLKVYTGSAWEQGVTAGSGFLPLTGGQLTGNLTFSGSQTVDGRDLSADGAKLDGIEAGATADQTKADIDALGIAASTAATLATARNIALSGDVSGSASFNGSADISITATVADDSHNHVISNVDGLQTALDAKLASSSYTASDVLTKVKTVDGAGSGLDADLWDGNQFSSYLNQAVLSSSSPNFNNLYINDYLIHTGDTDTYLGFGTNTISLVAGNSAEVTINTTGVRLGDTGNGYFQPVSGNYGSIQIDGGAHSGWEGYSIGGRAVFMHDNGSHMGLYDDVNNEWGIRSTFNGTTELYYNGVNKFQTSSAGAQVSGNLYTDGSVAEDYDALSGTSPTCNVDNGGAFSLTMTGTTTFTFSGADSGWSQGFVLQLTGNGSEVIWPTSVDWAGGTAPDAPASGETDIYVFWTRNGGTTWYGVQSIDAAS